MRNAPISPPPLLYYCTGTGGIAYCDTIYIPPKKKLFYKRIKALSFIFDNNKGCPQVRLSVQYTTAFSLFLSHKPHFKPLSYRLLICVGPS